MQETVTSLERRSVGARVQNAIADASRKTGVDFNYLFSQARVESNLKPNAKATTSSATGLFQFTKQTWLATVDKHGANHGLGWAADAIHQNGKGRYWVADPAMRAKILDMRNQPEAASAMAAEFAGDNYAHLKSALGRAPEEVDLYLAHFLGANGASRFLKDWQVNPNQTAAIPFSKAAAANRPVFYEKSGRARSMDEVRNFFKAKLDADNKVTPTIARLARNNAAPQLSISGGSMADASRPQGQPPLKMLGFQQMPEKLSLDFARDTYKRLASQGWGNQ